MEDTQDKESNTDEVQSTKKKSRRGNGYLCSVCCTVRTKGKMPGQ